jgi:steroid delta-isomerase-like uncharacterized protein
MKKLFMILPLALILCFMVGCQDKEAMAELEKYRAQAAGKEQNKELIRNFFEEWNNRDMDKLNEMYVPDAKYHHPSLGASSITFEDAFEGIKMLWKAFPDLTTDIKDLFAEGDKVVVRFTGRGTHQGDLGGIPATGNKTEVDAMEIFHIENGKIIEAWEISDRLGLMMQLGMELKPKEKGEK